MQPFYTLCMPLFSLFSCTKTGTEEASAWFALSSDFWCKEGERVWVSPASSGPSSPPSSPSLLPVPSFLCRARHPPGQIIPAGSGEDQKRRNAPGGGTPRRYIVLRRGESCTSIHMETLSPHSGVTNSLPASLRRK